MLGIEVRSGGPHMPIEWDGILLVSEHAALIRIRDNVHPVRQRFTLAHEIAHFLLHRHLSAEWLDGRTAWSDRLDAIEREANRFAAALLMPVTRLLGAVEETPHFETLCYRYNVSRPAMRQRLHTLGLLRAVEGAVPKGVREIVPVYERVVVGSFDPDDPSE
jgi:Zn-dependent peptidase ImmA (M78 family)